MQLSLVLAVIGDLTTGTCRTLGCRLASNANDDPGLCLLHTFQHQSLRRRQGIPHNINGVAHRLNISNLSSLHRECGRTDLSAARQRPIYHQVEKRVEAHIFVAFLAYSLSVTLKQRLEALL